MRKETGLVVAMLAALSPCSGALADVQPAQVFQDNMVLQREMSIPVWGKAPAGEQVTVEFAGQKRTVTAGKDGCWRVELGKLRASSVPAEMIIRGKNEIRLKNILVGEVWLASGQSNMGFTLPGALNGDQEVAAAEYPNMRFLAVKTQWHKEPWETFTGTWQECTPENAKAFSAIAYFFAREIQKELGVPVGIIQSAWGGTPAEAWTPLGDIKARSELYAEYLARYTRLEGLSESEIVAQRAEAEKVQRHKDPGNVGEGKGWAKPDFDTKDWKDVQVPSYLDTFTDMDGAFWVRRDIEIPEGWAGKDLTLRLGAADDLDTTYFNGERIGATGFEVPDWWDYQRVYKVPGRLVKAGRNTLAVRVFDERYGGGLHGPKVFLDGPDGKQINLAGTWKEKDEVLLKPLTASVDYPYLPHVPSYLWNGMINPFVTFAMRGVIWHQGENNSGKPVIYRTLFKDMISAWRREWKQGDFPFYYVQLSNYKKRLSAPTQTSGGWPGLREAQTMALALRNTGMAVTIDVGDAADIHPRNKQANGHRLALIALARTYGRSDVVYSGPVYRSMKIKGDAALVTFDHAVGPDKQGLAAKGGKLTGFSICGEDRNFVWAEAEIVGKNQVRVSSPAVKKPVAVRYAWADNPECNLYNSADLPACPFRTDDFEETK